MPENLTAILHARDHLSKDLSRLDHFQRELIAARSPSRRLLVACLLPSFVFDISSGSINLLVMVGSTIATGRAPCGIPLWLAGSQRAPHGLPLMDSPACPHEQGSTPHEHIRISHKRWTTATRAAVHLPLQEWQTPGEPFSYGCKGRRRQQRAQGLHRLSFPPEARGCAPLRLYARRSCFSFRSKGE